MDTEARLSGFGLSLLGALIAISIAFAVSASVIDTGSLRTVTPVAGQGAVAVGTSEGRDRAASPKPLKGVKTSAQDGPTKLKFRCRGCGVVEAIHRVERNDFAPAICRTVQAHDWVEGITKEKRVRRSIVLPDESTLAAQLADPVQVSSERKWAYQMVVRFPDGSRHLFHEATRRTVQPGERIQVIPGVESKALFADAAAAASL